MSACSSGLKVRIKEVDSRAFFVLCSPHNLNLAVQDSMEDVQCARSFIGVTKHMINFIRDSPKRLAWFRHLQSTESPQLSQFCPIRWCLRINFRLTIHAEEN
ncbi:uncharacterized protein LOC117180894 [Belonocnema kinseyi]|uniref:uncharacterized protein LOC117180894 n=1 Tax=Belonocnema kinseyi TaxID=2817044 RepID=UPI00143CC919|nr:uncharacterized protein LOC117180894 [Belonocnema kinseyi]